MVISIKDSISSFWLNLSPPLIPSSHKYHTNSSLMQSFVLPVLVMMNVFLYLVLDWVSSEFCLFICSIFHHFWISQSWPQCHNTMFLTIDSFLPNFTHFQRSVLQLSLHPYCLTFKWQMNFYQPCKMYIFEEPINYEPVCISNLLLEASPSHILHFRFGEQSVYFESFRAGLLSVSMCNKYR